MIKQSVLKQLKKGRGSLLRQNSILERGVINNHCNNRIVVSFLLDILFPYINLISRTLSNLDI